MLLSESRFSDACLALLASYSEKLSHWQVEEMVDWETQELLKIRVSVRLRNDNVDRLCVVTPEAASPYIVVDKLIHEPTNVPSKCEIKNSSKDLRLRCRAKNADEVWMSYR